MTDALSHEAIRIIFSFGAPIAIALAIAGALMSIVQAFLRMNEPAINYTLKLVVFVVLVGSMGRPLFDSLQNLILHP